MKREGNELSVYKNSICIIYRKGDELSEVSMRSLKWFYGVIYKLLVDVFEETIANQRGNTL